MSITTALGRRRCKCGSVVARHSDLDDFGKAFHNIQVVVHLGPCRQEGRLGSVKYFPMGNLHGDNAGHDLGPSGPLPPYAMPMNPPLQLRAGGECSKKLSRLASRARSSFAPVQLSIFRDMFF
jgi:hypothetical protein